MKKNNIGSVLALYPTPAVVVGTLLDGRPTWLMVAHVGILGHDRILVSMHGAHHTNKGVIASGKLSVNIVDRAMLEKADYVGSVSGARHDKSQVFAWETGEAGAPVIEESPLVMECEVVDNCKTDGFDNFICKIANTYADPAILTDKGKVDYDKLKPVLFEMPTYSYLATGGRIGACTTLGRALAAGHRD